MNIKVNGINLFYEQYGSGQPLILLHGNGETHDIFDESIAVLSEYYTVDAMDSRCHGQSDKTEELSYLAMARDVISFIKTLNLKKPILCGFSDGGIIGLLVASKRPKLLSHLIVCGVNCTVDGMRSSVRIPMKLLYKIKPTLFLKLMLTEPNICYTRLQKIIVPTLMLVGEYDIIRPAHTCMIASSIHDCDLVTLDGEDHGSYIIHSKRLAEEILSYMNVQHEKPEV